MAPRIIGRVRQPPTGGGNPSCAQPPVINVALQLAASALNDANHRTSHAGASNDTRVKRGRGHHLD